MAHMLYRRQSENERVVLHCNIITYMYHVKPPPVENGSYERGKVTAEIKSVYAFMDGTESD